MLSILHLSSEAIPSLILVTAWWWLLRTVRYSGYGIALLSLVGTIGHEALHYIAGLSLGAKPVSVSLWPTRAPNGSWVLGSVGFAKLNIWNAVFVAFAPLALLPVGWGILQYLMLPAYQNSLYLLWLGLGYIVACCFFACVPSTTDIRLGALSALMYCTAIYGIWQTTMA